MGLRNGRFMVPVQRGIDVNSMVNTVLIDP
jgi:hypothetical protein